MADTTLSPPCGSKDGLGDLPSFSNPGPHAPTPSGSKDGLGDFAPFPSSAGDVHPQAPRMNP